MSGCLWIRRRAQSIPLYPGYACECTWKYRSISYVCCLEGFIKVMNGLVMTLKNGLLMTRKEDEIFKYLAAHSQYSLPVEALNVIAEWS